MSQVIVDNNSHSLGNASATITQEAASGAMNSNDVNVQGVSRAEPSKIAIVGISGRFPESDSIEEFMQNLYDGRDLITSDDRRWPAGIYGVPERHGQLKDIESLDAAFFRIHGAQAEKMDPQLRLLLSCTYEALNDAGLNPATMRGSRTGVYVGACFSDLHDFSLRDPTQIIGYENTGCAHSMFANRLSFAYDWNGPSFIVDTACSSSMVAFSTACAALERGDCDVAVVGGVSVTLRPEVNVAFKKLGMLSPDGTCHSFDTGANGYCRSECIGALVLSRVDAKTNSIIVGAQSDLPNPTTAGAVELHNTPVRLPYALVRAHGINNDGLTAKGITFPSVEAQTALNARTLHASGLLAKDIGYIEAHGTGTSAGDGVELKALDDVYGRPGFEQGRESLLLGSVKSNMGHAEGAAAIASILKVAASFDRNALPGNIHFYTPNTTTTDALAAGRMTVPTKTTDISHVKCAAISSFGFGGTNAHCILERPAHHFAGAAGLNQVASPNAAAFATHRIAQEAASLSTMPVTSGASSAATHDSGNAATSTPAVQASGKTATSELYSPSMIGAVAAVPILPQWLLERLPLMVYSRTHQGADALTDAAVTAVKSNRLPEASPAELTKLGRPLVLGPPLMENNVNWIQTVQPIRATVTNGVVEAAVVDNTTFDGSDDSNPAHAGARPVWIAFTGNGGMWPGMGTELYATSPVFKSIIDRTLAFVTSEKLDIDVGEVLFALPQDAVKVVSTCSTAAAMISQVALQIGLLHVLRDEMGLRVGGFMGHSAGEIAAAYLDGCISLEQAILVAFHRNDVIDKAGLGPGAMAAAGLTREAAEELIAAAGLKGKVVVGCHNDPSGVTLSGEGAAVDILVTKLNAENVFCRKVETKGVAHHSPMLVPLHDTLVARLAKVIPSPKRRSANWITTCAVADRSAQDVTVAETGAAEYFAWNFIQAVEWVNALQHVPRGAVIIEVGPHALLASPTKRSRPDLVYVPTMKKAESAQANLASTYAALFRAGALDITLLLGGVATGAASLPVPASLTIKDRALRAALVQWDFRTRFPVQKYVDVLEASRAGGASTVTLAIQGGQGADASMLDHIIDGKPLVPAAAYVRSSWFALAEHEGVNDPEACPVELLDFVIHQATQMDANQPPEKVIFKASITPAAGGWKAISLSNEEGELITTCRGRALSLNKDALALVAAGEALTGDAAATKKILDAEARNVAILVAEVSAMPDVQEGVTAFIDDVNAADAAHAKAIGRTAFYTNIRSRGYEYGPTYRAIVRSEAVTGGQAALMEVDPASRWSGFVDGLLQALISPKPDCRGPEVASTLAVPTRIDRISIRPDLLLADEEILAARKAANPTAALPACARTITAVESWSGSAHSRWASVEGLQMKSIKRSTTDEVTGLVLNAPNAPLAPKTGESPTLSLTEEVVAPLFGALPLGGNAAAVLAAATPSASLTDASVEKFSLMSNHFSLVDAALETLEHTTGSYDKALDVLEIVTPATVSVALTGRVAARLSTAKLTLAVPKDLVEAFDESAFSTAAKSLGVTEDVEVAKSVIAISAGSNHVVMARDAMTAHVFDVAAKRTATWVITYTAAGLPAPVPSADYAPFTSFSSTAATVAVFRLASIPAAITTVKVVRASRKDLETPEAFEAFKLAFDAAYDICIDSKVARVLLVASMEAGAVGFYRSLQKEGKDSVRALLLPTEKDVLALLPAVTPADVTPLLTHPAVKAALASDVGLFVAEVDGSNARTVVHSSYFLDEHTAALVKETNRLGAYVNFSRAGDLTSAVWLANHREAAADEVVVDVMASALNFKDVMLAYGKIDPSAFYGRVPPRSVGFELAGVDRATGKRVMGFSDDAIATVAYSKAELLWEIPAAWTFNEAATVPVVYATAYYALFVRGGVDFTVKHGARKPSVLIHAAAGGVGQAATRIALARGLDVYVTCSASKVASVQKLFPTLPAGHIFDSRSTAFERGVMRATKGKGVDLVLNSLSDEKLQASTRVLAQHGKFLEIGKYDIMEHSALDLHLLVKNIAVHGIDVDQVRFNPTEWNVVHALVTEGISSGEVIPLGFQSFATPELATVTSQAVTGVVTEMFRYMAEGLHVGKVILDLEAPAARTAIHQSALRPRLHIDNLDAQIIIGGLGGFGLALAWFLAERGSRRIFLTGRAGVTRGEQTIALEALQERFPELHIEVVSADVGKEADCVKMLQHVTKSGAARIGGIYNLAMVLADTIFDKMDGKKWITSSGPKVAGSETLLQVLKSQNQVAENFVTFSSVAAGLGNVGQTNYAYGNSFMDSIARNITAHAGVKTAISVQWGTIGDVGVAARQLEGGFLETVLRPQPLASCLATLERLMLVGTSGVFQSYLPAVADNSGANGAAGASALEAVLAILRLPAEGLRPTATLESMGMDSMQAVEVQSAIRRCTGTTFPVAKLQQLTVAELEAM